jgi:hypothetical protein
MQMKLAAAAAMAKAAGTQLGRRCITDAREDSLAGILLAGTMQGYDFSSE